MLNLVFRSFQCFGHAVHDRELKKWMLFGLFQLTAFVVGILNIGVLNLKILGLEIWCLGWKFTSKCG